jgi:hypothetical protein
MSTPVQRPVILCWCTSAWCVDPQQEGPARPPTTMRYVRELWDLPVQDLISYLSVLPAPTEPSAVYEVATEEKRVEPGLRQSTFQAHKDSKLFDLAARLVEHLSASDDVMAYRLVRSDVTHIVYGKGGFFKAHQDYLSLTSNCIQVGGPATASSCLAGSPQFRLLTPPPSCQSLGRSTRCWCA